MDIQEMIMRNAEDKKTLEELKEKVLDGERKVFSAILEEIAEKTGASFENNKLNTFSGVFRIGYSLEHKDRQEVRGISRRKEKIPERCRKMHH